MQTRPLEGIRVLDLTWVLAGPYATMLLADLGADVVKVERVPGGDPARHNGPYVGAVSSYFASINRGKRSITLDLTKPAGKALLLDLVAQADVLAENFRPGTLDRLGLGYAVLSERNPRLIHVAISGFGQTGPYSRRPAYDVIAQAMSGTMSITGTSNGEPVRVGYSIGDLAAGLYATIGILAALHERERSGHGQYLDVSMLEAQLALLENAFVRYFATGEVPHPLGTRHPLRTPVQAFPTRDGWLVVAVYDRQDWERLCKALERPDLTDDPRFAEDTVRHRNHAALEPILSECFRTRSTEEWVRILEAAGVPVGPVNRIDQIVSDPHVQERKFFVDVPLSGGGSLRMSGHPVHFSRTPAGPRGPVPALGEHTDQVLAEWLGLAPEKVETLRQQGIVQ